MAGKNNCHIYLEKVCLHLCKSCFQILLQRENQYRLNFQREDIQDIQSLVITEESKAICERKISGISAFTDFSDVGSNNKTLVIQQCEFDISVSIHISFKTKYK